MAELKNVLLCHSADAQKVGACHVHSDDKGFEASDVFAPELVVVIPATAPLPVLPALTSEFSAGSPVQGAWQCRVPCRAVMKAGETFILTILQIGRAHV